MPTEWENRASLILLPGERVDDQEVAARREAEKKRRLNQSCKLAVNEFCLCAEDEYRQLMAPSRACLLRTLVWKLDKDREHAAWLKRRESTRQSYWRSKWELNYSGYAFESAAYNLLRA